jgi:MFS family permease
MSMPVGTNQRHAGTLQGVMLLLPIIIPVMGTVVLAPVLPKMLEYFATVAHAEYLVPLALTVPGLCIAFLSPVAGVFVDFFGRRRILIYALASYAVVGVLPLVLDNLLLIIASRAVLGALEAVIVTASTTLIGDFFHGDERAKWFAYQTALASTSAVVLIAASGALGNIHWRVPFTLYASSLLIVMGIVVATWEPAAPQVAERSKDAASFGSAAWRILVPRGAVAVFSGTMFYTLMIQLGVVLDSRYGIHSPGTLGGLMAIGSLSVPLGALTLRRLTRLSAPGRLFICFVLLAVSFLMMNYATTYQQLMVYVVINQFSCGLLCPTVIVWMLGDLPFEVRGRATGVFTACWFIGQVISPQAVTLISKQVGGLLPALQWLGLACLVAAFVASVNMWRRRGSRTLSV